MGSIREYRNIYIYIYIYIYIPGSNRGLSIVI